MNNDYVRNCALYIRIIYVTPRRDGKVENWALCTMGDLVVKVKIKYSTHRNRV